MGHFAAVYVELPHNSIERVEQMAEKVKKNGFLFTVRYYESKPWVQFCAEEPENISYYAENLSKIFPEQRVVGLGTYTVSDSVCFCEYKAGDIVRLLESGFKKERVWEKIEGNPQPWETEIIGDRPLKIGSEGIMSNDLYNIGNLLDMPGFGVPQSKETWTLVIEN